MPGIAPLVGLAGQTSGETVAVALRRNSRALRQARAEERYAERLGRSMGVAMKAGQMLWLVTVGSMMPAAYWRSSSERSRRRLPSSRMPRPA